MKREEARVKAATFLALHWSDTQLLTGALTEEQWEAVLRLLSAMFDFAAQTTLDELMAKGKLARRPDAPS